MDTKLLKTRDQIDDKYKWNISKIYANDAEWEKDFLVLKSLIPEYSKFKGALSDGQSLLGFLNLDEKIYRLYLKMYMYSTFRHHSDTSEPIYQSMMSKIEMCGTDMRTATSFFVSEIIELGDEIIDKMFESVPDLELYRKYIYTILDSKEHVLSKEVEAALAQMSDAVAAPDAVYSSLCNSDMTFPKIKDENGIEVDLTDSNYGAFIRSSNRRVREEAFKAIFGRFGEFKNTFATNLLAGVKNVCNLAKLRKYNSALEYGVDEDDIPVEVYNTTIDTINDNLSSLHKYVSLKKKLLGYEDIHMYDLYASLFEVPNNNYPFETGVSMAKEALSILGDDYINVLSKGLEDGWCDVYPNKGKRGGAYSWGSYDTMPYFFLNYVNELNDVFTLVHELGHSMHTYYSNKSQPFVYSGYTIFNAEVASTTNEIILVNHLIENTTDKNMRLYLITHELEQIRTTVFRQTMFAEFEKIIHGKIDDGVGLSAQDICDIYYDLNVKYHGNDMVVDDEIRMEWARIPHFYSNFYVYKYVTGYAAATMFASTILKNEPGALDNYKKFLCSGGSDYSIEIQKSCGVDMTTSTPINTVISRFNYLLELLENEIEN